MWDKNGSPIFKLDAWIYWHATAQWQAGGSLYDWWANPAQHLWPFTYPPFAAWAFTPLIPLTDGLTQVLLTLATPACVAWTARVTLRRLGADAPVAAAAAPWIALGAVALLEPVPKTMEYGQVNAILMAMVAGDLLGLKEGSRWRGVLSGLAAAVKLTPAIAVLALLVRRDWRGTATMVGTALGATAVGWALSPRESAQFFAHSMWDPGRAGLADYSGNQNVRGAIARFLPESVWGPVWAVCAVAVLAGACMLLAQLEALRALRPEEAGLLTCLQVSVTMTTGLLISPISWSHHWVWCLPALMCLVEAGRRWREPGVWTAAAAGVVVFALAMQWWFPEQNHVEQDWPWWATVVGSSYTWWALGAGGALSASAHALGADWWLSRAEAAARARLRARARR